MIEVLKNPAVMTIPLLTPFFPAFSSVELMSIILLVTVVAMATLLSDNCSEKSRVSIQAVTTFCTMAIRNVYDIFCHQSTTTARPQSIIMIDWTIVKSLNVLEGLKCQTKNSR